MTQDFQPFKFDYWMWWEVCVNELRISPSEAWNLDFVEINKLLKNKNSSIDTSVMLNYERVKNGAAKEWLQKAYTSQKG